LRFSGKEELVDYADLVLKYLEAVGDLRSLESGLLRVINKIDRFDFDPDSEEWEANRVNASNLKAHYDRWERKNTALQHKEGIMVKEARATHDGSCYVDGDGKGMSMSTLLPTLTTADQATLGQCFINAADGQTYRAHSSGAQGCRGCSFRHLDGCKTAPRCGPVVFVRQDAGLLAWHAEREMNALALAA